MGQKINPTGFRLAVTKDWASKWFAKSTDFSTVLKQDIDVRNYLRKKLANASVGRVVIERLLNLHVLPFTLLVQVWLLVKKARILKS